MKLFFRFLLLTLVALPLVLTFVDEGRAFARAEDSTCENCESDDEDEAQVEDGAAAEVDPGEEDQTEEEEDHKTQGSPDIDVTILFTKPVGDGAELPAGKAVEFLLGVVNSGDRDYVLDAAEASFRYPMDFNFYIQNFSVAAYNKPVKPHQEATVMYTFYPAEVFAGRPLGLQINLAYHDADGQDFVESIFNSTVNIVEVDEGLDGETFFLYVFLFAFAVLVLFLGHTALTALGVGITKKSLTGRKYQSSSHNPSVEMGTTKNGVDYDWLPDQLKIQLKKQAAAANGSAKAATNAKAAPTRTSPRLRKA